jgi:hypothetical protein
LQVGATTRGFGYQRIGCLLDAIVEEPIGILRPEDKSGSDRFPNIVVQILAQSLVGGFQQKVLSAVADAGKQLQSLLGFNGQPAQFLNHEVHHIIGVTFDVNAIEIPTPFHRAMIESKQFFLSQCRDELNGEKRITSCFPVNQLRQGGGRLCFATKRIRNQLSQVPFSQRCEDYLANNCSRLADRFEFTHQRMCGSGEGKTPCGLLERRQAFFQIQAWQEGNLSPPDLTNDLRAREGTMGVPPVMRNDGWISANGSAGNIRLQDFDGRPWRQWGTQARRL